ncbi:hypothetical protein ASJ79_27120 [Mycobacterium sp. NAZ190054]|nr:hypothetical protein ASJ79_27120 [Mycobacterium sp. NAZ190054]
MVLMEGQCAATGLGCELKCTASALTLHQTKLRPRNGVTMALPMFDLRMEKIAPIEKFRRTAG